MNTLSIPILASEFHDYQNSAVPLMNLKQTEYGILPKALTDLAPSKVKWDKLDAACISENTKGLGATANRNAFQPIYSLEIESIVRHYLVIKCHSIVLCSGYIVINNTSILINN